MLLTSIHCTSDRMHNDEKGSNTPPPGDGNEGEPSGDGKPSLRKRIEDWLYPAAAVYTLGDAPEKVVLILQRVVEGLGTYLGFATKGLQTADQAPWLLRELGQIPELVVDLRRELLEVVDVLPAGGPELDRLVEGILTTCFPGDRARLLIRNDKTMAAVREWALQRRLPGADPTAPDRTRP